jgi:hypothetical protein
MVFPSEQKKGAREAAQFSTFADLDLLSLMSMVKKYSIERYKRPAAPFK